MKVAFSYTVSGWKVISFYSGKGRDSMKVY